VETCQDFLHLFHAGHSRDDVRQRITPITRWFDTANRYNRDANSPSPAGCRVNRALIETLDKDAIRAWLR
jgi:hypothetical protein